MIRNTKQRDALMKVIRDAERPLSPAEIHQLALAHYPKLGIRTVYRYIKDLVESHQIAGIDYPGQPVRYEVIDDRGSRPHLICRYCQKTFDLSINEPRLVYPKLKNFVIEGHEVVYFGHCRACRSNLRSKKSG